MTVLQMRDTDEGNQLPKKKRRLSRLQRDDSRQSTEAWVTEVKSESESYWSSPGKTETEPFQMPAGPDTMVNSYGLNDPYHQTLLQKPSEENGYCDRGPIAALFNVGNTCFLNSVLYTLRYAPSFLHKLHHLNCDCEFLIRQAQIKEGFYSLGRNGKNISGVNLNVRTQAAFSKLHQVYMSLCLNEIKEREESFQPTSFLHALREVNPMFEGNQQHDAHELLVCIIDILRETCEFIYQQNNFIERITPPPSASSTSSTFKSVMRKSLKFSKIIRSDKRTTSLRENRSEGDFEKYLNGDSDGKDDINGLYPEDHHPSSQSTLFDDFRGVSLLRTTCLECEQVTERKETFCDICVPIQYDEEKDVDELYQSIIVTEEYLMDCNKYWCEKCLRYNEAKRCVKFEKLPRLLTLHLKRFSSGFGNSLTKVNDYMPTPLLLSCFCEECLQMKGSDERSHFYTLYAIIMHVGQVSVSGHYVAYVKQTDQGQDYMFCTKDKPKTSSLSRGTSINSVASNSNNMLDKGTISKYLMKLSSKSFNGSSGNMNSREVDMKNRHIPTCKGTDCCSIRRREMDDSEHTWLQCDDHKIQPLSTDDLLDMLSPSAAKSGSGTPYLLFYSRVDL